MFEATVRGESARYTDMNRDRNERNDRNAGGLGLTSTQTKGNFRTLSRPVVKLCYGSKMCALMPSRSSSLV